MDDNRYPWAASWAWGLPLIVLNVVIHVAGLALINARVDRWLYAMIQKVRPFQHDGRNAK